MTGEGQERLGRKQQEDRQVQQLHICVGENAVNRTEQQGQYKQENTLRGEFQGVPDSGKDKYRGC